MNWLFPGFLAGAVLIGLPVVLHLLRRKPRGVLRFPTLRFLGETALRDTRRHRLLRWLTLLLRCLAIALLCAAFARPYWGAAKGNQRTALVIALDNSMSQQAVNRWADAQRWALAQLEELSAGDQAALLIMHPEPTWAVPLTDDLAKVRTVLAAAQPGYFKTRYAQPLRLAGDALEKTVAGKKILAWAADGQRAGWRGADLALKLPPRISFRFNGIAPAPSRQAAIITARPALQGGPGIEVVVRQFQAEPEARQLSVWASQQKLTNLTETLHAGDNTLFVPCEIPAAAAGVRIAMDADDLPADDAAWLAVAATKTNLVYVDAAAAPDFIFQALRATHKLTAKGLQPVPLPPQTWAPNTAAILHREASFRDAALLRLQQFHNAGGAVWVFVDGSAAQKEWLTLQGVRVSARTPAEEPWHLRDWDVEHPALAAFAGESLLPLLEVEFYRGFNLSGATLTPIANWPDGRMALAQIETAGRRLLLAGFSPSREATDWMVRPSFVPFVHGAARWLGAGAESREDWRVGDLVSLPAEAGTWRALDALTPQPELTVSGTVRPTAPGLYEFNAPSGRKFFAVNVPVEESDLAPWPNPDQLAALESPAAPEVRSHASITRADLVAVENQQRLWWWLLAAGGAVFVLEGLLANRAVL